MAAASPSTSTTTSFQQSLMDLLLHDSGASSAIHEELSKRGSINSNQLTKLNKLVAACVAKTLTPEFYKDFSEKRILKEEEDLVGKIKILSAKPQSSSKRSPATIAATYPSPLSPSEEEDGDNIKDDEDFQFTLDDSAQPVTAASSLPITISSASSTPKKIEGFSLF